MKLNDMEGSTPERTSEIIRQAIAIADEAARTDIECNCKWTSENPQERWFNTVMIEEHARESELRDMLDRSIAYLEMRGRLERHAEVRELVRIRVGS